MRDAGTQSSLLLGYPSQLNDFPPRILETTVLPAICSICSTNPALWVYALQLHVYLSEKLTLTSYQRISGPHIEKGLAVINPAETMMAFMKNVLFIKDKFPIEFYEEHVTLLFLNALDKPHIPLQCAALQTLCDKRVSDAIPQALYLDKIVPKACREACKNPDASIKVSALYFLSNACARLDKGYMAKNLVPSLKYISEHDHNPAVTMCVIGTFQSMTPVLGSDLVAASVLPVILPMLTDKALSASQFQMIVSLTKSLLKEILDERTTELKIPKVDLGNVASFGAGGTDLYGGYDPFALAKEMIAAAAAAREKQLQQERLERQQQAYNNFSYTSNSVPDPVPDSTAQSATVIPQSVGGISEAPPPLPNRPAPSTMPPPPPSAPPPSALPIATNAAPTLSGFANYGASNSVNYSASSSSYESSAVAVKVTGNTDTSISNASTWYSGAATAVGSLFTLPTIPVGNTGSVASSPPTQPTISNNIGAMPVKTSYSAPVIPMSIPTTSNTPSGASATGTVAPAGTGFSWFLASGNATAVPGENNPSVSTLPSMAVNPAVSTTITPASAAIDINEDDFVASFQKSSTVKPISNNNSWNSTVKTNSNMGLAPSNVPGVVGTGVPTFTLEQQIAQTQAEIARLSGAANTYGTPVSSTMGSVGNGNNSTPSGNVSGFSFIEAKTVTNPPVTATGYTSSSGLGGNPTSTVNTNSGGGMYAHNYQSYSTPTAVTATSGVGSNNYTASNLPPNNTGSYNTASSGMNNYGNSSAMYGGNLAANGSSSYGNNINTNSSSYGNNAGRYGNNVPGNSNGLSGFGNGTGGVPSYGNSGYGNSGGSSGYGNGMGVNNASGYGNNTISGYGNSPGISGYGNNSSVSYGNNAGMSNGYGNNTALSGYGNNTTNTMGNKNIGQISTGYKPPVAAPPSYPSTTTNNNKGVKDDPFGIFK